MVHPHFAKDFHKFSQCTHLEAHGCVRSSSWRYANGDLGIDFSTDPITADSIVGISTNGTRPNRKVFPVSILEMLKTTGCRIVTDTATHRNTPYNLGEREVAAWLLANGYSETQQRGYAIWTLSK